MKKILVPVDFSIYSEYAVEAAAHLAREYKSEVIVLHMLGLSEYLLSDDEAEELAEARYFMKLARTRFSNFLDKPYLKGIKFTEIVQNYKIFSEISVVAKEQKIDLIVMGSHGAGGMRDIFVGSNTEKVVRNSEIPVLVIKRQVSNFNPRKVVYAMDFRPEGLQAFQRAMQFLSQWNAEVHLVHVNLPNLQFMSTTQIKEQEQLFLNRDLHGKWPANTQHAYVSDYSVERGLYAYAEKIGGDLIAVSTHGRRGLAHFFRGSVGEDIANHAPLPVITFKVY